MIYGYARVSTDGQSVEGQRDELKAAGCDRTFAETGSGANSTRPELAKALAALAKGDTLIVVRLDRLARSTRDLLNLLAMIGEKGAAFRSLRDPWADTTTAHGRLMLTVLGGLAEFERDLIRSRTQEGRTRAKARGVKMGRPSVLTKAQRDFVLKDQDEGKTVRETAAVLGVSASTVQRERRRA